MNTPARLLAVALSCISISVATAAAAVADTPVGDDWPDATPTSTLEVLLFFGGGTAGLFVAISIMAVLLSRNNYVPPEPGTDVETAANH